MRVLRAVGIDVTRTDAVRREAADQVRAHLEVIQHAQISVLPSLFRIPPWAWITPTMSDTSGV